MPHSHSSTACKNSETFKEPQAKMASSMQEEHFSCRWRGLRWRVMLGVLPPCPAPIEDLRCAVANGRRRYAELRRCLLVDPHVLEEIQKPNHLSVDNPLSQDPESAWGKYFQSAEVERIIDKDLTRLYPEHETFFQSPVCQAMLRRILLVWSLIHPHYSYRQGMHELLAPFLYVLHNDTRYLSELKQKYDDLFGDKFDDLVMQGLDLFENDGIRKGTFSFMRKDSLVPEGSRINSSTGWRERIAPQDFILLEPDEFGFDLRAMVLGNDTYGAEGELGCLLSQRFVEHDAYCMFDALMSGQGGHVAMAEYFTNVTAAGSAAGLSPVLEASTAVYQALAAVDSSLYLHLVELGIEPQFFALRWLRLLFGREFVIDKLLLLWDAIFAAPNATRISVDDGIVQSRYSHRSTFISALAVTMLLCLRPSLLASQDDTSCLHRLLNFPGTVDIGGLIDNAKLLQPVAEEAVKTPSQWNFARKFNQTMSIKFISKGNVCSQGHNTLHPQISYSPKFLKYSLPDSYWEEKWKNSVLQKCIANERAGQENMQLSNKALHKKSLSHDSTVLITGAAGREKRQPLLVEGATQGMHPSCDGSNTVVECKISYGTTEEGNSHLGRFIVNSTVLSEADCQKQDIEDVNTREASREDHLPPFYGKAVVAASDPATCHYTNDFHEEEDGFTSTSPFSQDGTSVEYDAQSSTSSVTSEDGKGNSPPFRKSRSSVASSHTSKLLWLWNLGKRQSSDKTHIQKKTRAMNSENPISAKACQNLVVNNSCVHSVVKARNKIHACNDVTSNLLREEAVESSDTSPQPAVRNTSEFSSDGSNVSLVPQNEELLSKPQIDTRKGLCDLISDLTGASQIPKQKISTVLQILGQSVLDNIQVLEIALSQRTSVSNKEGLLGHTSINKEKPEHSMTTFVIGKGPVAAMAALAELRKISNLLLEL